MSILDEIRKNPEYNAKNSVAWFTKNVRDLAKERNLGPMKMLGDNIPKQTNMILPGAMYMFTYDPKGKDKLPYYDTFPLVIPFNMDKRTITGLNLHYIEPKLRLILLNNLMQFVNDKTLTDKSRMIMSWKMLQKISKHQLLEPCVKKYLKGQVKSKFLQIMPHDWQMAVFLPLERFRGNTTDNIWAKTRLWRK